MTEDDTFLKLKRLPISEVTLLWETEYVKEDLSDDEFKQFVEYHGYTMREFLVAWLNADYYNSYAAITPDRREDLIKEWLEIYG